MGWAEARAAPITAQSLLGDFTNIVLGDLQANVETEGPVFVGGDYNGGANVNPDMLPNVDLGDGVVGTLIVGGDLNGNANLQPGNAVIGGALNGSIGNNGGGQIRTGVLNIPVQQVIEELTGTSTFLSGVSGTGGTASLSDQNQIRFQSVPGADGIAVFNVENASFLSSGNFLGVTADPGVTTIINVGGEVVDIGINANNTNAMVLFNFYEATEVNIDRAFNYSLLAPFADVTQSGGGINGTVVSRTLTQNAEIRPLNFAGELPDIPLPPGAVLLLSAIGLGWAVGKRGSDSRGTDGRRRPGLASATDRCWADPIKLCRARTGDCAPGAVARRGGTRYCAGLSRC